MSRVCNKCNTLKDEEHFYKSKPTVCKDCVKKQVRDYSKSDRGKEVIKLYRETDEYKESISKYSKSDKCRERWKRADEKRKGSKELKARNLLRKAVYKGKIEKPTFCTKCNIECNPEGHHTDYNKPLDVIWLCAKCHRDIHKEI